MKIRMWRISVAEPFGLHCWFDPELEVVSLRELTDQEKCDRIDMHRSVSGLQTADLDGHNASTKEVFLQEDLPF